MSLVLVNIDPVELILHVKLKSHFIDVYIKIVRRKNGMWYEI